MYLHKKHFHRSAIGLAVLALMEQASAQSLPAAAAPAEQIQKIEITGSLIRRVSSEGALPVSSIKATELEARGHTELKDLVLEMPQSLSLGTNSGAAGPVLNLRGLGPMRTLTLLDGRRLANEPLQDQYVSVSVIPRMALERAETLRDGASSIYGADAIGGVQNFVTKRSYKGISTKIEWNQPEADGGGETKAIGAIAGFGDLNADGWNAYISVDHQRKSALFKGERPELFAPEVLNNLGLGLKPENKNPSPMANFGFSRTANNNYNPTFATGCVAPYSLPTLGARSVETPPTYAPGCYRDPNYYDAVSDGSEITNVFAKGTLKLSASHSIGLELLHSTFNVQKYRGMQTPGPTAPFTSYTMPSTSRFYPGAGITPAIQVYGSNTGANAPSTFLDQARTPGVVSNLNMANRAIFFVWGPAELGSAYRNDEQTNDRIVLKAEGVLAGWDYRAGLNYGQSQRDTHAGGGYIRYSKAQEGFNNGTLNPFGLQDEAGLAYLRSIEATDYLYRVNKAYNQSVDATISREVMALSGGPLILAVSTEVRRDSAKVGAAPTDLVTTFDSSGNASKHDLVGENPVGVAKKLHRDIRSAVIEVDAPVTSMLTLNAAVRADHYSDLKLTTVNPKVSFRLQPTKMLVLRGSGNTGFRAPSIMDIQNPTPEVRTQLMDDPVLCPSATPLLPNTGIAVAPFTGDRATLVCNVTTNYWTKSPDNSFLKPEKSRGFSFGAAIEPMKNLSITADYWGIKLTDVLGAVAIGEIQQNPAKYESQILRKADGTIDHIVASQANRGDMRVRGVDLSLNYLFPATPYGTFDFKLDGTYYEKYEFTSEKGGVWLQNVGIITNDARFGGAGSNSGLAGMPQINFRWKHTAAMAWRSGPWKAQISQRYNTGLTDVTPRADSNHNKVKGYTQYNLGGSYSGIKNVKLSLGVNNVTNADPMVTANTAYTGYITSAADILGRTYKLTAEFAY